MNASGQVVQVTGGVVDVVFPEGDLPEIFEAIEIPRADQAPMILEVEKHLGNNWARWASSGLFIF